MKVVLVCVTLALTLSSDATGFGPFECSNEIFFNHDDIGKMRAEHDSWIVVRILGDCETERQVKLIRRGDQIEAVVSQPLDYPIRVQLSRLENRFPGKNPQELCELVQIREASVLETQESALLDLASELENIRLGPVFEPVIYIHGVTYRIWVGSSVNLSYFEFEGPPFRDSARARKDLHQLDEWGQKLMVAVDASCKRQTR